MSSVLLIRHAQTHWNAQRRIQGQSDLPLDAVGERDSKAWRVPALAPAAQWWSSPLARARRTAANLGASDLLEDPRLTEMHWGRWEGRSLAALRAELGPVMAGNEARGLDFRPDGGESPREVCRRLASWVAEVSAAGRPVVAVTHKGVVRAALALATGWDMRGRPPAKLRWDAAHAFEAGRNGALVLGALNQPLVPGPRPGPAVPGAGAR